MTPVAYGQPGSSWVPQAYPALHEMGIGMYLDEAVHVGIDDQPFYFRHSRPLRGAGFSCPVELVIFPEGFHAPRIMELARLQAWTLKPAVLR